LGSRGIEDCSEETILSTRETEARTSEQNAAAEAREERARDGAKAMLEYIAEGRAARERMAELRAMRLAKEAAEKAREASGHAAEKTPVDIKSAATKIAALRSAARKPATGKVATKAAPRKVAGGKR
jgi:hypothetical protein